MKKVMVTMALLLSGLAAQAQEGLSLGGHVALPVFHLGPDWRRGFP